MMVWNVKSYSCIFLKWIHSKNVITEALDKNSWILDADPPFVFVIKIQGGERTLLKNFNVSMLIKPYRFHFVENFLETP